MTATGQENWTRVVRPDPKCSPPVDLPPVPLQLPADPAEPLVTLRVPEPVVLFNTEYRLSCSQVAGQGPKGPDVRVQEGEESAVFHWTELPDISPVQLHRIAEANLGDLLQTDIDPGGFTAYLEAYQITALILGVAEKRAAVQASVETLALAALDCYWENNDVTAQCSSPSAALTGQVTEPATLGVNNPSTVVRGTVRSKVGQGDANALALSLARAALGCVELNDEITVTCLDVGFAEAVPNDPEGTSGRRRVGVVTVPAGVRTGSTKEQANAAAQTLAAAGLDCFYTNTTQEVNCEENDATKGAYTGNPVAFAEARPGNPVTIPAGTFIVDTAGSSTDSANAVARDNGRSLLRCTFFNTRQVLKCEPAQVGDVTLVPKSSIELEIPEGTYEADSQTAADALARAMGLLQLQCQYCNSYIPPTCVRPDYSVPPGSVLPAGTVTTDWSVDATSGLAPGVVCDPDPAQVMVAATALAQSRIQIRDAGCAYVNDTMWFGCLDQLPGATSPPKGGYHHPNYPGNTTPPAGFTELPPLSVQLSPFSTPAPTDPKPWLVMEAGAYQVRDLDVPAGEDPKLYVNAMARRYGMALLDCRFANPDLTYNCESAHAGKYKQDEVAKDAGQLVEVQIPRATYESASSFREAVEKAQSAAKAVLNCYYSNDRLRVSCWLDYGAPGSLPPKNNTGGYGTGTVRRVWVQGGKTYSAEIDLKPYQLGSLVLPYEVQPGEYISHISKEDANLMALRAAVAVLDCASQARDVSECNDDLVARCGGMVEPNPRAPLQSGTNEVVEEAWTIDDNGVIQAGDGNNYVLGLAANGETWEKQSLGASQDPIGGRVNGALGPGVFVPACSYRGASKQEANIMAYRMARALLTCASETNLPGLGSGQGDLGGGGGSDGAQTNCKAECIAVFA